MKIFISIATTSTTVYHGSPYSDVNFRNSKKIVFVTTSKKVAKDYALGKIAFCGKHVSNAKTPTLYKLQLTGKLLDFRNSTVKEHYEERRRRFNGEQDDPDNLLPSLKSEGFIQSTTGLPGYGHVSGISHLFKDEYSGMYVDEGPSHGISIAVWDPKTLEQLSRKTL